MAREFRLKHDFDVYYPSNSAAHFTEKEMRALYSEYRKVAVKRIKRLSESRFSETIYAKAVFDILPKNASGSQIRKSLYEVAQFLSTKTSSVRGQKEREKKFIATMKERGYDFINKQNAAAFGRYMEKVKIHYGNRKGYYPEGVIELYEEILKKKADPQEVAASFDYYMQHYEAIPDKNKQEKEERRLEAESRKAKEARRARTERSRRERTRQRPGSKKLRPLGSGKGKRGRG